MAKQNGECHLSKTGGEDAFNVLNKADKRQVNCYVFSMGSVDGVSVQRI